VIVRLEPLVGVEKSSKEAKLDAVRACLCILESTERRRPKICLALSMGESGEYGGAIRHEPVVYDDSLERGVGSEKK
jgi:hypothetical protein